MKAEDKLVSCIVRYEQHMAEAERARAVLDKSDNLIEKDREEVVRVVHSLGMTDKTFAHGAFKYSVRADIKDSGALIVSPNDIVVLTEPDAASTEANHANPADD